MESTKNYRPVLSSFENWVKGFHSLLKDKIIALDDKVYASEGWAGLKRIISVRREVTVEGKKITSIDQAFLSQA